MVNRLLFYENRFSFILTCQIEYKQNIKIFVWICGIHAPVTLTALYLFVLNIKVISYSLIESRLFRDRNRRLYNSDCF